MQTDRQTDRQAQRQTDRHDQKHYLPTYAGGNNIEVYGERVRWTKKSLFVQ